MKSKTQKVIDWSIRVYNGLIENGVKGLKEFGYPNVDVHNILTDKIYSAFFKSQLEGSLGQHPDMDIIIKDLIQEIDTNNA